MASPYNPAGIEPETSPASGEEPLWALETESLYLMLGGRTLKTLEFPALVLTTPFTRLNSGIEQAGPPWNDLPRGVDVAVVPALPAESRPPALAVLPSLIRYVPKYSPRYFVDLSGSFEEYLAKLGQNARHNLRRRIKRFTEFSGGEIQWKAFRAPEEMSAFHSLAGAVAENSWQKRTGGRLFPQVVSLDQLTSLAAAGRVRAYALYHQERPVAFSYCVGQHENLVYTMIGYDEAYAQWSPGNVLYYLFMKSLFEENRYQHLDFTDGILAYKDFIKTDSIPCARVLYFRRTLKHRLIIAADLGLMRISTASGRLLNSLGLKARLKKLILGKGARPGQA